MQHDVRVYTPPSGKAPDATPTTLLHASDDVIALGALDAAFARYPARVQLLLVVDATIDERRFREAVAAAIAGIALGPVRMNGGSGCALSVVESQDEALFSQKPPSPLLFAREPCAAPLAWRLSVGPTKSAIGLSFDHALCDVGGAVLLLKRASWAYTAEPMQALGLDRSCQSDVAALRAATTVERVKPRKGGCLVVDFASHCEAAPGRTRHAVLFAAVWKSTSELGYRHRKGTTSRRWRDFHTGSRTSLRF